MKITIWRECTFTSTLLLCRLLYANCEHIHTSTLDLALPFFLTAIQKNVLFVLPIHQFALCFAHNFHSILVLYCAIKKKEGTFCGTPRHVKLLNNSTFSLSQIDEMIPQSQVPDVRQKCINLQFRSKTQYQLDSIVCLTRIQGSAGMCKCPKVTERQTRLTGFQSSLEVFTSCYPPVPFRLALVRKPESRWCPPKSLLITSRWRVFCVSRADFIRGFNSICTSLQLSCFMEDCVFHLPITHIYWIIKCYGTVICGCKDRFTKCAQDTLWWT